jgi:hypothetical protein
MMHPYRHLETVHPRPDEHHPGGGNCTHDGNHQTGIRKPSPLEFTVRGPPEGPLDR